MKFWIVWLTWLVVVWPAAAQVTAPFIMQEQPIQGRTPITVGGATVPAGRALHLECTAVGTFTATFADASSGTYTVNATGPWTYAWAVTAVTAQTAICTYENWK